MDVLDLQRAVHGIQLSQMCVTTHNNTIEYPKLDGTHKDHRVQR